MKYRTGLWVLFPLNQTGRTYSDNDKWGLLNVLNKGDILTNLRSFVQINVANVRLLIDGMLDTVLLLEDIGRSTMQLE